MPTYVRVRGLARRKIRVRSAISAANAISINNKTSVVVDLDDAKTRADLNHHISIGQLLTVGAVARGTGATIVDSGVIGTAGQGSSSVSVTSGTLRTTANATVAVAATTVTAGASPATGKRVDLVQVDTTSGAVTLKAGVAAAVGAVAPAPDAGNLAVAEVIVEAGATGVTAVNDVRPLP